MVQFIQLISNHNRFIIVIIRFMYQSYDRQKSRERSRDRDRKFNARSPSEDDNAFERKQRYKYTKSKSKRVKQQISITTPGFNYRRFEGLDDIRVFRKEDEPTARGLCEQDILKIKTQIEKEIAKSYDFNWQHYKHRDAQLESNSMKEQKEKEKALSDKLMSAKQLLAYFNPPRLCRLQNIIQPGCDSLQRESHTTRIHDILGCYYTHVSQIPNQPQFQILNTNTTLESKIIKFDNDLFSDQPQGATSKKNAEREKVVKGILKMPHSQVVQRGRSQPRQIDPQLIYLLKDFKINPQLYTKEKTEQLLKPYRDSGELDFLMRNKEVLEAMLKNTSTAPQNVAQPVKPNYQMMPNPTNRESSERSGSQQPSNINPTGYSHTFVPKADKFRTVPCKYFHSPQGCSKVDNCTFIHDERYAGVSAPNSQPPQSAPMNIQNPRVPSYVPPAMYGYSMPMGSVPPMQNPNYYGHPMSYPGPNPAYYGNPGPHGMNPGYQPGYPPMNKPSNQQYMNPQQQYGMSNPPPNQGYSNPNYQYYIGNNPNK